MLIIKLQKSMPYSLAKCNRCTTYKHHSKFTLSSHAMPILHIDSWISTKLDKRATLQTDCHRNNQQM